MRCVSLLVAVVSLTGCLPAMTTMQRTTTLPVGETSVAFGAGVTVAASAIPSVDLAVRHGLSERVDLGLRVGSLTFPIVADVKFQLVRTPAFELAVAPGVGTSLLFDSLGAPPVHLYLPVLAGVPFGADHRFVVASKYVWMSEWTEGPVHAPGVAVGFDLALNERARLMPMLDGQCLLDRVPLCLVTASAGVLF